MVGTRRGARWIVGLLLSAVAASSPAAPGQAATGDANGPRIDVVATTTTAHALQPWNLTVRVSGAPGDFSLRLTAHQRVTSLVRFQAILDGGNAGDWIDSQVPVPFDSLKPAAGDFTAAVPLVPEAVTTRDTLRIPGAGVYPVDVALVAGRGGTGRVLAETRTWLVTTDPASTEPIAPINLAWIVRLTSAPVRDANSNPEAKLAARLAPGQPLGRLGVALQAARSLALTFAPDPELLESWRALEPPGEGVTTPYDQWSPLFGRTTNEILTGTYVRTDPARLVASGLTDALRSSLVDGHSVLEGLTGRAIDVSTMLTDAPTPAALSALHGMFVSHVVVPQAQLQPIDSSLRYRPFSIAGAGMVGVASDDDLTALLTDPSIAAGARVAAYTAALSVLAQQSPSDPNEVVLRLPDAAQFDSVLVRTLANALTRHPYIHTATIGDLFAHVPIGEDAQNHALTRALVTTQAAPLPGITPSTLRIATRRVLATARDLLGGTDTRVAAADRALELAIGSDAPAAALSSTVVRLDTAIRSVLGAITTPSRTITLTARRADIPLTFTNHSGRTVRVRVELHSAKLRFPHGAARIVTLTAHPESTTVPFDVETLASGQFGATVTLASADGAVRLTTSTQLRMNSTVFGALGTWLTIGALGFLGLWWAAHFFRRRRDQGAVDG